MKKKARITEREHQRRLEVFAEKHLQHATAAAEITRDRNQKAESAEKEGRKKFWHDGFRLMVRPAALSTRRHWWAADWRWPSRVSQRLPHRRRYGRG